MAITDLTPMVPAPVPPTPPANPLYIKNVTQGNIQIDDNPAIVLPSDVFELYATKGTGPIKPGSITVYGPGMENPQILPVVPTAVGSLGQFTCTVEASFRFVFQPYPDYTVIVQNPPQPVGPIQPGASTTGEEHGRETTSNQGPVDAGAAAPVRTTPIAAPINLTPSPKPPDDGPKTD